MKKTVPKHPQDRLSRRLKNKSTNIISEVKVKQRKQKKYKDERQSYIKLLDRYHLTIINGILNTVEILIHITLERNAKTKILL